MWLMICNEYPRRSFHEAYPAYVVNALEHIAAGRSIVPDLFIHGRLFGVTSESTKRSIFDLVYWDRSRIGGGGGRMLSKNRLEICFKIADAVGAIEGLITSNKKLRFDFRANRARGRRHSLRCLVSWLELFRRFKVDHFYTLRSVVITK